MNLQNLFQQLIHPGGHKQPQKTHGRVPENEEDIPRQMFAFKL
jgi:hypothetical protein